MEEKIELSDRQKALIAYIVAQEGRHVSKREIYENVAGYEWNEAASDKCSAIRLDMKAINASDEEDKTIILDGHQCYYWPTKKEFLKFRNKKVKELNTRKAEVVDCDYKLGIHGTFSFEEISEGELAELSIIEHDCFRKEQ